MRDLTGAQRGTIAGLLFWFALVMVFVGGTAAYFGWGIIGVLLLLALIFES